MMGSISLRLLLSLAALATVATSFIPIDRQDVYNALQQTSNSIVYTVANATQNTGNSLRPSSGKAQQPMKPQAWLPVVMKDYDPNKLKAQFVIVAGNNYSWTNPSARSEETNRERDPMSFYQFIVKANGHKDDRMGLFVGTVSYKTTNSALLDETFLINP